MRLAALLAFVVAAALGIIWPWAQLNMIGEPLMEMQFSKPEPDTAQYREFELSKSESPVRIRFQALFTPGASLPPIKVPVKVTVADTKGTLIAATLSFPTKGIETGPEQVKIRGSQPLQFEIQNDGRHVLYLSLAPNPNDGGIKSPGISGITASVLANAPEIHNDYKAISAAFGVLGVYLLLRSRRRKPRSKGNSNNQRWGRGE